MISAILYIFSLIISIIGLTVILMLWSNIKSKQLLEDINKLIQEKTFKQFKPKKVSKMYFVIKRAFDLLFAFFGLISYSPLFLIISLLIKLDSKGPVFIKYKRIGKGGKPIYVYKFRTIKDDSDNRDDDFSREYTKIGLFLYKTALSQIPMLFNVIQGQISLVGISPYNEVTLNALPEEVRQRIISHKPGIISLWAVSSDKQTFNWDTRPYFDLYYDSKLSLWLDLFIIIRAIAITFAITAEY